MTERERFEKATGDPSADGLRYDERHDRYVGGDDGLADCWNWAWFSWKDAKADSAEREAELVAQHNKNLEFLGGELSEEQRRNERLVAEVERLQEALMNAHHLAFDDSGWKDSEDAEDVLERIRVICYAAINPEQESDDD